MRSLNQYLVSRNGRWHYVRRVPEAVSKFDTRPFSKAALKTTSLEVARIRRDAMAEADDLYWASLVEHERGAASFAKNPALTRYRAAKKRALARGFVYTPVAELVDTAGLAEIIDRLNQIQRTPATEKQDAEALLGGVEPVAVSVTDAFKVYCDQLALTDLLGKRWFALRNYPSRTGVGMDQRNRNLTPIGSRSDGAPVLSIVIPMFNEEGVLSALFECLGKVLNELRQTYEIVCVDDGSQDRTRELLAEAHARDPRIKMVSFSRNFGKDIALTAGLDHAGGQAVIPIDADLQDPPELIKELFRHWTEGYDVVNAVRADRTMDSFLKRFTAQLFYSLINRLSTVHISPNTGDFRLLDRRVANALCDLRERNRFMKGLFSWVGYKQNFVPYSRQKRAAGKTKFTFWKLWNFALDGITGYSTLPLRVAGYLGILCALIAMCYALFLMLRTLTMGVDVPGYASIMTAVIFMGGIQLVVLGVIGEYLGRMYDETKNRLLYIVESTLGDFEGGQTR